MKSNTTMKALLVFFVMAISGCSSLLYYPTSYMYVDKEKLEYQPKEVNFVGPENKKIVGWYFRSQAHKPKAVLLFFHGNAQNISSHFFSLYWILKYGYDFFIFDYPGYGGSEGEPTPESTVESGKIALQWLRGLIPADVPLAVFGQSLGGNIAMRTVVEMKEKVSPCMVAIDSSFASYKEAGRRVLKRNILTWPIQFVSYLVLDDKYSAYGRIEEISPIPLIVMHGTGDGVVEFVNGEEIFSAAAEPKEFWRIANGDHTDVFIAKEHAQKYQEKFLESLSKYCR